MHTRGILTFNKESADNSEEARRYAWDYLEENGFCSQGRFTYGISDWFVIGGRWSGELQDTDKFFEESKSVLGKGENEDIYMSDLEKEQNKKILQEFWESLGKSGANPYVRDNYGDFGAEDDAQIVTKEVYDKFLKEFEGESEDGETFWDLDYQSVDTNFIGKKWIVVIDYHN